jgi:putative ABC transport system permease protein
VNFAHLQHDFGEAVRGLRRSPGFTLVVTLTLAVGLGGALATISVMDRVLFRPPGGVTKPDQLRRLELEFRFRGQSGLASLEMSYPDLDDLSDAGKGRASVLLYSATTRRMGNDGPSVSVEFVGRGYFSVLGVRPMVGRFFTDEETKPQSPAVDPLVLSAAFWRREFGGDSSALGRSVTLSGRQFTVVGIAQSDFRGLDLNPTDVWAPVGSSLTPGTGEGGAITDRSRRGWNVVARLDGGDWPELLVQYSTRLRESYRSERWADSVGRVIAKPLNDAWEPSARGEFAVRNATLAVRLAFVAIAVLLVSILHGAIMLSLRALQRRREIAIRLALGMPRRRLVLHHVLEALIIAALASGAAVLIGWWGATLLDVRVLSALRPAAVVMDGRLIAMSLMLISAAFAATSLVPALTSRGISPTSLRSDGVAGDAKDSSLRQWLVSAEVAACVALVMLAALSLRSLERIGKADFGFDGDRLITFAGPFGTDARPLRERVAVLPFVESTTAGPPLNSPAGTSFAIQGRDPIPDSLRPVFNVVPNDYLRVVGARLLVGRMFSETDVSGAQGVVVITRSMAARFWPGASALGQCILAFNRDSPPCRYVVGVIDDIRWDPGLPASPRYFLSEEQVGPSPSRFFIIRTRQRALSTDAAAVSDMGRREWSNLTPRPVAIRALDALEPRLRPLRAASTLFLLFGLLALLSAAGGVYGLISYQVSNRTREIGIRKALGASTLDVAKVVARWVTKPFAVGVVIGAAAAFAGGRVIAAFLFETAAYDPAVLVGVAATIGISAFLAALIPARRAVGLDPAHALRDD